MKKKTKKTKKKVACKHQNAVYDTCECSKSHCGYYCADCEKFKCNETGDKWNKF